MRKESRKLNNVTVGHVQSYHEGRRGDYESYAFEGFKSNKYFTSDRFIPLDENYKRIDGKPIKGVGIEVETECSGISNYAALADVLQKIIFREFPDDLFKLQHDSSLGVSGETDCYGDWEVHPAIGVECISQIMTKQFVRNHYKDFQSMYDVYFRHFDFSCSRSGNCGMHVNVSNALFGDTVERQKDAIRKLHYFVNRNYDFACRLFARDTDYTDYCGEMYYGSKEYCKTMDIEGGSHGTCMNYSHFHVGRVEIRLVGGQSDFQTFRNTMESVFFIVDRMKKISWDDLDDMVKVFKGCNQYVAKRLRYCHLDSDVYNNILLNVMNENLELV